MLDSADAVESAISIKTSGESNSVAAIGQPRDLHEIAHTIASLAGLIAETFAFVTEGAKRDEYALNRWRFIIMAQRFEDRTERTVTVEEEAVEPATTRR